MTHAEPEHRLRFVSAAQSLPYATTYVLWVKNGGLGPQPVASIAEMRVAVYDQAKSASELRAFRKVAGVASVELAQPTVAGLKAGHIIITYTALRGLIERIAHTVATAAKLKSIKETPPLNRAGPTAPRGISRCIFTNRYLKMLIEPSARQRGYEPKSRQP
jgi:hypothetical protein